MNQVSESVLVDVLTDLQVEIQAIHLCLVEVGISLPAVEEMKKRIVRQDVRAEVVRRLSALQSAAD